jgi:hypothetical protein
MYNSCGKRLSPTLIDKKGKKHAKRGLLLPLAYVKQQYENKPGKPPYHLALFFVPFIPKGKNGFFVLAREQSLIPTTQLDAYLEEVLVSMR